MKEFDKLINAYSFPDSIDLTKNYLQKYWLTEDEYLNKWKSIQTLIFSLSEVFPKMVFNSGIELLLLKGGLLFVKNEFETLRKCLRTTNDKYFIIIEDFDELKPPHESGPLIRLKYPVDVTWEEINIGDGLSYELYQRPIRNYFVFGDSGNWGKYVANDYKYPLDIFGFQKEYASLFITNFKMTKKEEQEIKDWIPLDYKAR
ncbi:MAG: hypothetical protein GYA41_02335 [Bacteroidales bacterium]|nr:hypothetical protein [Bacteroidales bacterium]